LSARGSRSPRNRDPAGNLKQRSLRGGAIVLAAEGVRAVVVVGYLGTIARLLTPADFGVVAMSMAVLWVLVPLSTMGLSVAAVQTPDLTDEALNAVFWASLAFASVLALAAVLAAPLVGLLYRRPELVAITRVLSVVLLINGLAAAPSAILRRQLRFGVLSGLEFGSLVISAGAALLAAAAGLGHWSLVLHELTLHASIMAGAWVFCGWRPGAPGGAAVLGPLLDYGRPLTAFRVLESVRAQFDRFLVGMTVSPAALGSYTAASNLLLRIMRRMIGPVSGVAVSSLARLQEAPREFCDHYRLSVLWAMTLSLPVVSFVALEPDLVVVGLLGAQWTDAIPIFWILALGSPAVLLRPATNWVLQAIGRPDRQLRWAWVEVFTYLAAFLLAVRWGVLGIAAASTVVAYVTLVPRTVYSFRHSPVGARDLLTGIWRPVGAILLSGTAWVSLPLAVQTASPTVSLGLSILAFLAIYGSCWLLLPGGRREARDALRSTFSRGQVRE